MARGGVLRHRAPALALALSVLALALLAVTGSSALSPGEARAAAARASSGSPLADLDATAGASLGAADDTPAGRRLLVERRRRLIERASNMVECIEEYRGVVVESSTSANGDPASNPTFPKSPGLRRKEVKDRIKSVGKSTNRAVKRVRSDSCKAQDAQTRKFKAGSVDCSQRRNADLPECVLLSYDVPCAENDCRPQCYNASLSTSTRRHYRSLMEVQAEDGEHMLRALLQTDEPEETEEVAVNSEEGTGVLVAAAAQLSDEEATIFCRKLRSNEFKAATRNRKKDPIPDPSTFTEAGQRRRMLREGVMPQRRSLATSPDLVALGVANLDISCQANGMCNSAKAPYDANTTGSAWQLLNSRLKETGYLPSPGYTYDTEARTDTYKGYNDVIFKRALTIVKYVTDTACGMTKALAEVSVEVGWIVQFGASINPGEATCAAIKFAMDVAQTVVNNRIADASFHDGVINGYEILANYENGIVAVKNQATALRLTKTAITTAQTAVTTTVTDVTTNITNTLTATQTSLIDNQVRKSADIKAAQDDSTAGVLSTLADVRTNVETLVQNTADAVDNDLEAFKVAITDVISELLAQTVTQTTQLTNLINDLFDGTVADIEAKLTLTDAIFSQQLTNTRDELEDALRNYRRELTRRMDNVDAQLCTLQDEASLVMRDVLYATRLNLMPDGKRPGYEPSPKTPVVPNNCTRPQLLSCSAGVAAEIAADEPSWRCTAYGGLTFPAIP